MNVIRGFGGESKNKCLPSAVTPPLPPLFLSFSFFLDKLYRAIVTVRGVVATTNNFTDVLRPFCHLYLGLLRQWKPKRPPLSKFLIYSSPFCSRVPV